jgi:hypothetical protein
MASGGEQGAQRVDSAELRARIVELRRRRLTFREIAAAVGRSPSTVHEHYEAVLKEIPAASVAAHRAEMLDQLDEAERAVLGVLHGRHVVVSNGHVVSEIVGSHPLVDEQGEPNPRAGEPIYGDPLVDDGPVLDAARTLVAIQARKAKLLGADAPSQVELGGQVQITINGVDPAADLT